MANGDAKSTNKNVEWLDERGTWWFYMAMIAFSRYVLFVLGVSTDVAWCAVISSHSLITFWLIHYKQGSLLTWDDDGGKYDGMTYWEQIDNGIENTGNRKFLRIVPIILFIFSYRQTSGALLYVNMACTLLVLVPKRPSGRKSLPRSGSYGGLFKAAGGVPSSRHRRNLSDMSVGSVGSEIYGSETDGSENEESTPDKKTS